MASKKIWNFSITNKNGGCHSQMIENDNAINKKGQGMVFNVIYTISLFISKIEPKFLTRYNPYLND